MSKAAKSCMAAIKKIPTQIKELFTNPDDTSYNRGEIVGFVEEYTDGTSETLFGELVYPLLHTVRFDNNGFFTRVGTPCDISQWNLKDDLFKTSMWNGLIHGVTNSVYPQNYGWTLKFSKEPLNLSDLTVSKLTSLETQFKTKPPNCETNWPKYLEPEAKICFPKVWKSIGSKFTNPKDEHTWLVGLMHRDLFVRSKDRSAPSKRCRLCKGKKESIDHFAIHCKVINKVKQRIRQMLVALGHNKKALRLSPKYIKPWLSTMEIDDPDSGKTIKLSSASKALLRIMWRTTYAHFVKVSTAHKPFNPASVARDTFRRFMSRIMAFQDIKRKFYLQRRYSYLPRVLSRKAAKEVADIGKLECRTGRLKIRNSVREIFKKYKVWNCYNKQILRNSYKRIPHRK